MIQFTPQNFRLWSLMGINPSIWSVAFPQVLNPDTTSLLTADLGRYSGLMRTASKYPQIFYNVGIAEQNMVGIGAGLAMSGSDVYMTTYAPFMIYRCFDQFRHLIGNMNLNIKAIGSAAGFSAGKSGTSLLAISDIALARSVPNITVLQPADCTEAIKMMLAFKNYPKPVYMRFCGAVNIPVVYKQDYNFEIGKGIKLNNGEKIALIATGTNVVYNVLKACEKIKEKLGFLPLAVNIHTLKPIDETLIKELLLTCDKIFTFEEHNVIGGLASAVSEVKASLDNKGCEIIKIGVQDKLYNHGSREYIFTQTGLDIDSIVNKVIEVISR